MNPLKMKIEHKPVTPDEHKFFAKAMLDFELQLMRAANTKPRPEERAAIRACLIQYDKMRSACGRLVLTSLNRETNAYTVERYYYNRSTDQQDVQQ